MSFGLRRELDRLKYALVCERQLRERQRKELAFFKEQHRKQITEIVHLLNANTQLVKRIQAIKSWL